MDTTIQLFDTVVHKTNKSLTDGTVIKVTPKTATVVWGEEELLYGYKGTQYRLASLQKQ